MLTCTREHIFAHKTIGKVSERVSERVLRITTETEKQSQRRERGGRKRHIRKGEKYLLKESQWARERTEEEKSGLKISFSFCWGKFSFYSLAFGRHFLFSFCVFFLFFIFPICRVGKQNEIRFRLPRYLLKFKHGVNRARTLWLRNV